MLAAQPGFGVRHTSHTPLVKHRTDPAKASPVQRPSLITNVPTSIPTPSPTPPSSHGVDAWSPADKVLHCTRSGCESTFSGKFRKTNLQKHLNHSRIHNPHGGFLCDECGESIGRKDNLDQHKRSVHGVDLPMKRRAASSRTRGPRNEPGDELPRAGEQGSPWELQAVHHRP